MRGVPPTEEGRRARAAKISAAWERRARMRPEDKKPRMARYRPVPAAEKYAEVGTDRPRCWCSSCRGGLKYWHSYGQVIAGGRWLCPAASKRGRKRLRENPEYAKKERRRDTLRAKGISPTEYRAMLEAQGGTCALCPSTTADASGNHLHVDHDHETGRVRGLLCTRCNYALVSADTYPGWLKQAEKYLRRSTALGL